MPYRCPSISLDLTESLHGKLQKNYPWLLYCYNKPMKDKVIIIGASTVGKSSLVKYLRETTNLVLDEMDEMLTRMNNGVYPKDGDLKHKVLMPQMVQEILGQDKIIFFANTNAFSLEDLETAHTLGFMIILLVLSPEKMEVRNKQRMEHEGYDDISMYFKYMIEYQELIKDKRVVDKEINTDQPVESIAGELLEILHN